MANFARDAGLSQPVAANYFFAENSTARGNRTTGTGSSSGTGTGGSVQGEFFAPSLLSLQCYGGIFNSCCCKSGHSRIADRFLLWYIATSTAPITGDASIISGFELFSATSVLVVLSIFCALL